MNDKLKDRYLFSALRPKEESIPFPGSEELFGEFFNDPFEISDKAIFKKSEGFIRAQITSLESGGRANEKVARAKFRVLVSSAAEAEIADRLFYPKKIILKMIREILEKYGKSINDLLAAKKNGRLDEDLYRIFIENEIQKILVDVKKGIAGIRAGKESKEDHLTGLLNLKGIRDAYRQIREIDKRNEKPTAVIFFDLDGFKALNSRIGYDAADEILKEIAKRIPEIVRATDAIARRGGDEFAIVLSGSDLQGAAHLAEIIQKKIERMNLGVTASIGVVSTSLSEIGENASWKEIVKIAAGTMMLAKDAGKNGVLSCDTEIFPLAAQRFEEEKGGSSSLQTAE
jgi:diguanylate cyclase (GGDEF)-like protein